MWSAGRTEGPLMDGEGASFAIRFGRNLVRARAAAGHSQEVVADLAGLHRMAVGQLERGERIPRTDTLVKLCGALRVEPRVLLAGLVWMPPKIGVGRFERPQEDVDSAQGAG
jgi:transcriptional regulator with XRE-family HTH domain